MNITRTIWWDVASRLLLKIAGILGPLVSLSVLLLIAIAFARNDFGMILFSFIVVVVFVWIPTHVITGCLLLCGIWTQARARRWHRGWMIWNGVYVGIVLLLVAGAYFWFFD